MIRTGVVDARRLKAGASCAKTKVDILEREKIRFIQQSHRVEDLPPDQHHAPADGIDHPDGIRAKGGESPAGGAMAHPASSFGEENTGGGDMVRLLSGQEDRRHDSQRWGRCHRRKQAIERVRRQDGVAVHQQDESGAGMERCPDPEVAAARKSEIVGRLNHPDIGECISQHRSRSVAGVIVDNQDFRRCAGGSQ